MGLWEGDYPLNVALGSGLTLQCLAFVSSMPGQPPRGGAAVSAEAGPLWEFGGFESDRSIADDSSKPAENAGKS